MLYKFKSKAAGDLIMLEPNGRQILTLLGKGDTDNLRQGILSPNDMLGAISALEQAVAQEEEARAAAVQETESNDDGPEPAITVSLRHRAAPFQEMIQRSLAHNTPIVWGV